MLQLLRLPPKGRPSKHLALKAKRACIHKTIANKETVTRLARMDHGYTQRTQQSSRQKKPSPSHSLKGAHFYTSKAVAWGSDCDPFQRWGKLMDTSSVFSLESASNCQYLLGRSLYTCLVPQVLKLLPLGQTLGLYGSDSQLMHSWVQQNIANKAAALNGHRSNPL